MATICAPGSSCNLIEFWTAISHCCPLPWILSTISEESICASNVKSTLVNSRLPSSGLVMHIKTYENSLAILNPVLSVNKCWAKRMNLTRSLEPTKLCTDLISPLSSWIIKINNFTINLASGTTHITWGWISSCYLSFNNFLKYNFLWLTKIWINCFAHFNTISILNWASWDICIERHEIISANSFTISSCKDLADPVVHTI